MKINKKEKAGNKVKLEIEVDYGRFKSAIDHVYADASSDLNIPGFRKGKAPRDMVEKYVDKGFVTEHAAQDLISDIYPEIIQEAQIEPVDYPNVVIVRQEEGKPFIFSLEVDVYPEVKLPKYKGISVESESPALTENEVDEFLKGLQKRFARFVDATEKGIEGEDSVMADAEVASEFGDLKAPPGKKIVIPKLTEEFVKNISNAPSLEAFREDLKKRLAEDKKNKVEAAVKNKLIEKVSDGLVADIPPGMVSRETELMFDELKNSLLRDKLTHEDYLRMTKKTDESLRKELKPNAEKRVRSKLALRAVANEEKLELADADLDREIQVLSDSSHVDPAKFRQNIGESGLHYIRDYLLRRAALEFIMSKAKISEKKSKK